MLTAGASCVRTLAASMAVALPLLAAAQEQAQPPQAAPPAYAPPPEYPPPPQYAPPPQDAPPEQTPAAAPRRSGRQRDSWYIGFGLGSGRGDAHFVNGDPAFSDLVNGGATTGAFNFRVGGTLTPKLLLGFDGGFVATDGDGVGSGASVQANYYDVGIMYFPIERGPFIRAGAGLSSMIWEIDTVGDSRARGFNVLGGLGYAFWLGRTFNLTLNLDVQRHWFDEGDLEGATATGVWLGFDWY
jgi:hypothetical protein